MKSSGLVMMKLKTLLKAMMASEKITMGEVHNDTLEMKKYW